jgi:hypothetical protein
MNVGDEDEKSLSFHTANPATTPKFLIFTVMRGRKTFGNSKRVNCETFTLPLYL